MARLAPGALSREALARRGIPDRLTPVLKRRSATVALEASGVLVPPSSALTHSQHKSFGMHPLQPGRWQLAHSREVALPAAGVSQFPQPSKSRLLVPRPRALRSLSGPVAGMSRTPGRRATWAGLSRDDADGVPDAAVSERRVLFLRCFLPCMWSSHWAGPFSQRLHRPQSIAAKYSVSEGFDRFSGSIIIYRGGF